MKKLCAYLSALKESGSGRIAIFLCALGLFLMLAGSSSITFGAAHGGSSQKSYEKEITALCQKVSSAEVYVSVNIGSDGELDGIAVVCEHCDNALRLTLTDMLSSLYGLGSNNIYIAEMLKS